MAKFQIGPQYRRFADTDLEFVKVKVLHAGATGEYGRIPLNDYLKSGAICGLQVTKIRGSTSSSRQLLGTAFFVAPGVAVSAWHVLEDFTPKPSLEPKSPKRLSAIFEVLALHGEKEMLTWQVRSWSAGHTEFRSSDLTAMGCHLLGRQPTMKVHHFLSVSQRFPALGEKLHVLGLKEPLSRGSLREPLRLEVYQSVGNVIEVFPSGRGTMAPGPCFAISTGATGGMSGSPVFDNNGDVLGVLSTGVDARTDAYSMVSSLAPVLDHQIKDYWHDGQGETTSSVREIILKL